MSEPSPRALARLSEIGVERLKHVGPKRRAALDELGVTNVFELLTYYPRRWIDRTKFADLSDLRVGDEVSVFAEVTAVSGRRTRQGRTLVEVTVADAGGAFRVVFFNQPWRERQLAVGVRAFFFGRVAEYRGARQMTNPLVDVVVGVSGDERDPTRVGRFVAVYLTTGKAGLTSWEIGGFVEEALRRAGPMLDPLDVAWRERYGLLDRGDAYRAIHVPTSLDEVEAARRRLAFDEFWRLQLLLARRRAILETSTRALVQRVRRVDFEGHDPTSASLLERFVAGHHLRYTNAQRRVLDEIAADLERPVPMHRLLQGDVGSGKTLVALSTVLAVVGGGRQCAMLAPTEVLAEQHLASWRRDVAGLEVEDPSVLPGRRALRVEILTGQTRAKDRAVLVEELAAGRVDVLVGTHALFGGDVTFHALGLIVIDEQHRFGVEQRALLVDRGRERSLEGADPDVLVMTATPIPRTAALVSFGDLDISTLDELPPGRAATSTTWLRGDASDAWARVRSEVAAGRRAFVVCPLVEESTSIEAMSATEERTRLATHELRGLSLGLLHGQLKAAEKDDVMRQFREGELDVLVATVVIEVGVDVPEASVIVIEDAWRFGLAQLHQLRGRVGRSNAAGYCYLLGEPPSSEGVARLEALVATNDGFELARVDLRLRREGTLLGSRQQGRSDLRLADLLGDDDLVEAARAVAQATVTGGAGNDVTEELRLFVHTDDAAFLFKS